jgi:hypothetical protein
VSPFELDPAKREEKPRPGLTPAERVASVVQSVMATEAGREFVKLIIDEFSINGSPLPHDQAKVQKLLPQVEAMIYNAAQQDVTRWIINLVAKHAGAQARQMLMESYMRGINGEK